MNSHDFPSDILPFTDAVRGNCDLSDAKDCGIYSMCTLFLRLRNLYKWQIGMPPWEEAEPGDLLQWIEEKEQQWELLRDSSFSSLPLDGLPNDPFDLETLNQKLRLRYPDLLYGAGHGRSMKAVFFLAEIKEETSIDGHPLIILDREICRELSSPFAMHQEGQIFFRLTPFRYFLWDKIQEGTASKARAVRYALSQYGVLDLQGAIDQKKLRLQFEEIALNEMTAIIGHELGELQASALSGRTLAELVDAYAASPMELVARGTKDILADTCPGGMLDRIIADRNKAALGFYMAMLDGMRRELFPEFAEAFSSFLDGGNWSAIEEARGKAFVRNTQRADLLQRLAEAKRDNAPVETLTAMENDILSALGLTLQTGESTPPAAPPLGR